MVMDLAVFVREEQQRLQEEARSNPRPGTWEWIVFHGAARESVVDTWLTILRRRHAGVSWDVVA